MPEESSHSTQKFIADQNVGKLARWLRVMGYDTQSFGDGDDSLIVARAVAEDRIILTRDTEIMKRRLITSGRLKAILITNSEPVQQVRQVTHALDLTCQSRLFTICLECNQPLVECSGDQVKKRVPPHVLETQNHYKECTVCHRVYWRGTHWEAMTRRLKKMMDKG
ncbi:Mut7-C RNAse domain-containing protein [Chloroflexota bacterium]